MKRIAEAIMIVFLVSASGATAFGQVFAGDMQRPKKKEPEVVKDNRKPKQDEKKGDDRRQKEREEPKKRDDRRRPEFR